MSESQDVNLREAFDTLRRETQAAAPTFASLTSATAMNTWRRRHRRRRGALLVAAIIIPGFLSLRARAPREPDFERFTALTGLDPGEVTWRAPSDFLLDVPGRDLLRKVPLIEIHAPALAPDSARPADSNATKRRSNS
ncbi:MAG TPA: hypothetical protein VIK50_02015 [Gemmatimonadaceae bacterium]